ncbi:hypothetical protein SEA_NEDARYA_39 [Gordonia phage Nedarya]|nr:hypothetical protein SEA_NEDARYA_39 [Gordonia phage Nedarya]
MEDREFFDTLYAEWAKTTGAGEGYLIVKEISFDTDNDYDKTWDVLLVNEHGHEELIANFANEEDADFFAAIHGCFADLVRRLHEALDEADRLDERRDEAEQQLASEIMLNQELNHRLEGLEH